MRVGPTTLGMVRIEVEGRGFRLPLDFDPEEAGEIAGELRAAAVAARTIAARPVRKDRGRRGREGP
ncbi:MAG: hypothetical protein IT545_08420 [Rhodobacteraceae bacterium]|nr:hypothetical protein [Paracoccaceae bacterium]